MGQLSGAMGQLSGAMETLVVQWATHWGSLVVQWGAKWCNGEFNGAMWQLSGALGSSMVPWDLSLSVMRDFNGLNMAAKSKCCMHGVR